MSIASSLEKASVSVLSSDEGSIFVTGAVRSNLAGTVWYERLELVDVRPRRYAKIEIYRLGRKQSDPDCS